MGSQSESEIRIPDEVVEAAAQALADAVGVYPGEDWKRVKPSFRQQARDEARAALQAALSAWGATVEEGSFPVARWFEDEERTYNVGTPHRRTVTPWLPVEADHAE